MSYMSEEEKLRRIQREEERRKREEAMLQEEELRHIRELERIRQMNGSDEDDDYDPEMDSAFVVDDESDGQLYAGAEYTEHGNVQPQYGEPQYTHQVQVPPNTQQVSQYEQAPQYTQQIQVPPTRQNDGYGQQYDQVPPQYAQQPQQGGNPQQRQTRGQQMNKQNTKPAYDEDYDDDDDGADFDVAAYRAAEREKKQRMHNKYAETEDKSSRKKNKKNDQDGGYDDGNGGGKKKKKKKHPIRKFFTFIFVILLILLIVGGLLVNSILSKFKHFDSEVSQRAGAMKGEQLNILLVGEDAREGEEGQRTDAMILCTINKKNGTVVLTSFMRDMYVDIPGYGGNRINAAYAFGGIDLLDQTIEENFGITIDGNALVDLSSFLESMTAVGDIEMNLTAEEAQYMNENPQAGTATDISDEVWDLHEGKNLLTPEQALCYARMRYVGNSDWERTDRQRRLIMACIDKVKHGHPISGIKMANGVAPCISTDLSKSGFLKMGWAFLKGGNMQSYRLPVDGYYYDDYIDGMAVLVPDIESNASLLHQYMSGDYTESESDSE
ncbi:MAG: LCP family protein [Eubacterium sp.]|nr:LCP family protein [Eubacterium sp.]